MIAAWRATGQVPASVAAALAVVLSALAAERLGLELAAASYVDRKQVKAFRWAPIGRGRPERTKRRTRSDVIVNDHRDPRSLNPDEASDPKAIEPVRQLIANE